MPTNEPPPLPPLPPPPPLPTNRPPEGGWKKALGPLAAIGILLVKFWGVLKALPVLKFLPLILKSGGTMIATMGVYALTWGWQWGVGFVILILVHELGHMVAARQFGLKVGAPVFIPFMGAFIALKEAPKNAWIESWVGIGGPLLGSFGALVCHATGEVFEWPLFIALAWSAYWLNLFNLIPVGQLDGGRIATALSPWLWVPGFGVLAWLAFTRPNFILWLVLILSLPRLISLFRKRQPEEERFYEIAPSQRWTMAGMYFGLIAALVFGMSIADRDLSHMRVRGTQIATAR